MDPSRTEVRRQGHSLCAKRWKQVPVPPSLPPSHFLSVSLNPGLLKLQLLVETLCMLAIPMWDLGS